MIQQRTSQGRRASLKTEVVKGLNNEIFKKFGEVNEKISLVIWADLGNMLL